MMDYSKGLIGLLLASALLSHPARAAGVDPAIAFYADTGSEVVSLTGDSLSSYGNFQFISLDGNVFAGSRHDRDGIGENITAYDASTGDKVFRIDNAFAPVVVADGRKIGFWPDRWGKRDPHITSVWLRNGRGRERRIIQLTGPRATVRKDPFEGDGVPLSFAFDESGRTMAVAFGNDLDLFKYDVYVVDVRTRQATRVTRGFVSRFPSLSPSGERLAVVREVDHCGGPGPGFRAAKIRVMMKNGEEKETLLDGSCELFYTDPRWISETELVAARLTRQAPGEYASDLVRIDVETGAVSELVTGGDVTYFTVSPSLQRIAFHRRDVSTGFFVLDLTTGQVSEFAEGFIPHLSGEARLI